MTIARLTTSSLNQGPVKKKAVLAGNTPILSGAYESIATVTVGSGGSSSISFTSIPNTYQHLQIRAISRGTASAAAVEMYATFNGTTTNYYRGHQIYGTGTQTIANVDSNTSSNYIFYTPAATSPVTSFSGGVLDILDYSNTNKNKTLRGLSGFDGNATDSGFILFRSGLWMNTAAISQIDLTLSSGNFAQYSHFALYGIR